MKCEECDKPALMKYVCDICFSVMCSAECKAKHMSGMSKPGPLGMMYGLGEKQYGNLTRETKSATEIKGETEGIKIPKSDGDASS